MTHKSDVELLNGVLTLCDGKAAGAVVATLIEALTKSVVKSMRETYGQLVADAPGEFAMSVVVPADAPMKSLRITLSAEPVDESVETNASFN